MAQQTETDHPTTPCPQCETALHVDLSSLQQSNGWARCGRCHFLFDVVARLGIPTLPPSETDAGAVPPPRTGMPEEWAPTPAFSGDDPPLDAPASLALADSDRIPLVSSSVTNRPWSFPAMKGLLNTMIGGLLLAAIVQLAYIERDAIALRWPGVVNRLMTLCQPLGCTVAPEKNLRMIRIISSSVVQLPGDVLQLDVVLENEASKPLAIPEVWLVLTDSGGGVFAEQGFGADDWVKPQPALAAGTQTALRFEWPIDADDSIRMREYRTELRYPASQ